MTTREAHPLGLNQSEWRLIRDAMWARTQVENGHYLPATRWHKAALRLIERGYLTRAEHNFSPPVDWVVVLITQENIDTYNRDLQRAIKRAKPKQPKRKRGRA